MRRHFKQVRKLEGCGRVKQYTPEEFDRACLGWVTGINELLVVRRWLTRYMSCGRGLGSSTFHMKTHSSKDYLVPKEVSTVMKSWEYERGFHINRKEMELLRIQSA